MASGSALRSAMDGYAVPLLGRCSGVIKLLIQEVNWILFIVLWLAIITWYDKIVEAKILDSWYFDVTEIEQRILDTVNIEE